MAQLIDIKKVSISPRALTATVRIDDAAPLFTDDDPAGTDLIANLIPELSDHACFGDGAQTFGEVMGNTELAHLLEHITVELLARTNRAGSISAGQTRELDAAERTFELRFACPDDVLVAGALSSASWVIDWAYNGGGDPEPDVDAIAQGLAALVDGLTKQPEQDAAPAPAPEDPDATIFSAPVIEDDASDTAEPAPEEASSIPDVEEPEAEAAPEAAGEDEQSDVLTLPKIDI